MGRNSEQIKSIIEALEETFTELLEYGTATLRGDEADVLADVIETLRDIASKLESE